MIDYKKNCFNLIRLIAAIQVFIGHAVVHLDINSHLNFIWEVFRGVPIFFCLSGFLIWSSIERTPDIKTYIKKRVFRIYPELWISVVISTITIIVLFHEHIKWGSLAIFGLTQGTFLQFWTPSFLQGYGCGTPNGALWTICVIVQFYLIAWFLHKVLKKKRDWGILIFLSVLINIITPYIANLFPNETLYKLFKQTVFPYLWLFAIGGFVWDYKEHIIKYLKKFWYIPGILLYVVSFMQFPSIGIYDITRSILLILFVFGFAYRFPQLNIKTDISYGIYVYHMIIINIFIELNMIGSLVFLILALGITAILAHISHYITTKKVA